MNRDLRQGMGKAAPPLLLLASLLIFAALKLFSLHYTATDENIYFYLAERMSEGFFPYRDFFHAHPPLHLLPLGAVYAIGGGFSLLAARGITALAVILAALLLYRMMARRNAWEALLAASLFLLSYAVLRLSTNFVGSNLVTLWVAVGLERLVRGRDTQSALAFALACFTLLNAVPAALGAGLVLFILDPRRGRRFALLGAGIFLCLNVGAVALFGGAFLDQVYFFHFGKTATPGASVALVVLGTLLYFDPWLMGGSLLGLLGLLLEPAVGSESKAAFRQRQPSGLERLRAAMAANPAPYFALGAALFSLVFLLTIARVAVYYFEILLLCLAPLAGFGIASLLRSLRQTLRAPTRVGLVSACVLVSVFIASQLPAFGWVSLPGTGGQRARHPWRSSGVAWVDSLARPLFQGGEEQKGRRRLAWTHYLWHEADHFDSATRLSDKVREVCDEEERIFGDSTSAPLVALMSGRRLFDDIADTNGLRFVGRPERMEALLAALGVDPPCAVVFRSRYGLFQLRHPRAWLMESYEPILRADSTTKTRSYRLLVPKRGEAPPGV
jgi:hypothetical protein